MAQASPIPVLFPITRMVLGGAQETVVAMADRLMHDPEYQGRFAAAVICGPDLGAEGELQSELRRRAIPLTVIPGLANPIRPHRDLQALLGLYRHIKRNSYTIVHTHSTKAGLLGRLAAKLAGVPIIVHMVHGWGFHAHMGGTQQRILVPMERLAAKICDRMITVTNKDIEKGLSLNIGQPEQYVTIRSGINLDTFGCVTDAGHRLRQELGIDANTPVVGTVTRLSPQKAPLDFVHVARAVANKIPAAKFVIVGDGPLRQDVEQLIAAEGLGDCVILTGLRRDIPELMSMFNVFLLTSLWEGLPRVLPQAMATQLPVVATAADGSMEIIQHGTNGFIAPPGAVQELAEHVVTVIQNPTLAATMGASGLERSREYSEKIMMQQLITLYDELLHEKGLKTS